jgi:hypothetical protein
MPGSATSAFADDAGLVDILTCDAAKIAVFNLAACMLVSAIATMTRDFAPLLRSVIRRLAPASISSR